jgi:hypothetical protein
VHQSKAGRLCHAVPTDEALAPLTAGKLGDDPIYARADDACGARRISNAPAMSASPPNAYEITGPAKAPQPTEATDPATARFASVGLQPFRK